MKIIGETIDDAAGEAFDKCAKIINLPYPGGPLIDKFAKKGDSLKFSFSKPKIKDLNYSFSGLKTSFLYFLKNKIKNDKNFINKNKLDICASIQKTIVDILMNKLDLAVEQTGIKEVAIAGGVSANSELRNTILERKITKNWNVFIPKLAYSTDNAAMIAINGYFKYKHSLFTNNEVSANARMKL